MIRRFNEDFEKFQDIDTMVLRYFAFDWDDNILHMPTKIHMEQKVGDRWLPIDVSTAEFANLRQDTENYRILGGLPEKAFSEFRDHGPRGQRAFLEDVKASLDQNATAPCWEDFLKCLSEGAIFSLITARGHESETMKVAVEYIIDNYLTTIPSQNPGRTLADEMYQNLKKFKYYFDELTGEEKKELSGRPTENPLVKEYLNHCDFFGVSSDGFASKFGQGSAANPEESKIKAVGYCIDKCMNFAKQLEGKIKRPVKVKFGMSDDDPKNSSHIMDYFSEKSGLSKFLSLYFVYSGKDTSVGDKSLVSGEKTKFQNETPQPFEESKSFIKSITETSHQTPGLESSVLPFTKWNNMTQRLYPNSKDAPFDDYHNKMKNNINQSSDLYKKFAFKRKKNKLKK
jgi:hypothetical protein